MDPRVPMFLLAIGRPAFAAEELVRPVPASDPTGQQAAAAAQSLGTALKTALEAELQTGGPVTALGVCKLQAPAIAGRIAAEGGLQVNRTSLKPRNPNNAPNAWQTEVLRAFESRQARGRRN